MAPSPTPSKILVFGATGVIGKFILEQLISAKPAFEKIGIFTSPGTSEKKSEELAQLRKKGVEVVVGDVHSESEVKKAFEGTCRRVFLFGSYWHGDHPSDFNIKHHVERISHVEV